LYKPRKKAYNKFHETFQTHINVSSLKICFPRITINLTIYIKDGYVFGFINIYVMPRATANLTYPPHVTCRIIPCQTRYTLILYNKWTCYTLSIYITSLIIIIEIVSIILEDKILNSLFTFLFTQTKHYTFMPVKRTVYNIYIPIRVYLNNNNIYAVYLHVKTSNLYTAYRPINLNISQYYRLYTYAIGC